jgi:antitoxin HicB
MERKMTKNIDYYMNLPYTIVVKKDKDNEGGVSYIARVLEIPHCLGDGTTPQEAMDTLNIHIRMAVQSYLRDGIVVYR